MLCIEGAVIVLASLWLRSEKKLTVDFTGIWGILGTLLIITGIVSPFCDWIARACKKPGTGLFVVGILLLAVGLSASVKLSELKMKNQELAIYVSLLLQENERIMSESDERAQEDSICYQYDGAGRSGDSLVRASEAD